MTDDEFREVTEATLNWASNVSDLWVGTLYQEQIDTQVETIETLIDNEDFSSARTQVFDLAQFLDQAEREYESREGENG